MSVDPSTSRKQQLIEAGIALFAEQGYHRTSVSDIVQKAGVAQGTFYHHFESKQSFFHSLLEQFFELLERAILEAELVSRQAETVADLGCQIRDVILRILTVYADNATLARIFLREAVGLDPDFADAWEAFTDRMANVAEVALANAIDRRVLPPQNSQVVSYCIVGMVERVAYHWLAQRRHTRLEEIATAVARFELLGIAGTVTPELESVFSHRNANRQCVTS